MYKVIIKNGDTETTIHDPQNKKFIFNKKVIQELNMSDYFSFSVDNAFDKSLIKAYSTIITVYDESDIVFCGRALTDEADLYNTNTIECDGALSYLYDTYYPPYEFAGTPKQMFEELIKNHNANVEEKKKFKIGEVSVTDPNDYLPRSSKNYSKTLDVIKKKLISSLGGYIRVKYNGDTNTIDYVDSLQHVAAQTIETAKNLLDINIKTDESDIITVLIPFGATDDETGTTLDVTSVNNGKNYIENKEAIDKYGRIYGTVKFDNVTVASNLLKKAESYLLEKSSPITTITLNAIDLHMIDKSIEKFKLGDWIRVIIPTHGINDNFLLSKIEYDLDNPENSKITLGTVEIGLTDTNTTIVETVSDEVNKVLSNLTAINVKVTGKLDVNIFEAFKATIDDLNVGNLAAKVAVIETSYVNKQYVNENYVGIQYANQTYAVKSEVKDLTADVAKINTLLSGSVTAGSTQTIVLNAENTTIANALIKSANIESVNADIINSGTLNTNLVQIQSQDGGVKINGNTQQFLDKNNKVRVQIGRDAQNNFNFLVVGEDGKTAIFNENGITKNAVPNGLIVDQMVSDGANIQGKKINITSLITEINGNSTMIESSHIKYDGKSLDVAFNSMQTSVSTVTKTITDNKSKWDTASTNASSAVTTANQAKSTAESANTNATNALNKASSVETRANNGEFDGRGVGPTSIAYQASANGTVAPTGTWTSTIPSVPAGQYLWTRTTITYTDKTTDYIYTVAKMGANGTNGSKGDKGDTGNGISTITTYYLASASASGVTVSTSGWTTTPQSVSTSKKYHWSYQIITYTNGSKTTTTPAIIGVYGDTGAQGATGPTGKGIKSVTPQYYLSTSSTTQSGGSWKTTQDTWSSGKYYWTRDSIVWSDNTTTYTTPTLDVGLNTANANALNAITKVTTVEETVKTQSTQITTAQGQISTLITDVTQAKKDITATKGDVTTAKANITTLTNNYSSIKQTVDGLSTTVGSHTSSLATIQTTVEDAKDLATNAKTVADSASTNATNAKTLADQAKTSASSAVTTANTAKTMADTAKSTADSAKTTATTASTNASNAVTTANGAKTVADTAKTLADSKAKIFTATPTTPYKVGDLWTQGASGVIMRCKTARASGAYVASDWEKADKYTDDTTANKVRNDLTATIKTVTDKQSSFETTLNGITSRVSSTETKVTSLTTTANNALNNANNAISKANTSNLLAIAMSNGKLVKKDVNFKTGTNGIGTYNNSGGTDVAITRIAKPADCPSTSGYALQIKHIGTKASPGYGGFIQGITARASAHFVVKYLIKLPTGYTLNTASNTMGNGYVDRWLTSNVGTNKYEIYVREVICGTSGTFSSGGHVYVGGGTAPSASAPLTWYVAGIWQYDITDCEMDYDSAISSINKEITSTKSTVAEHSTKLDSITSRVSTTETNITNINGNITSLTTRMSTAEQKVTDSAIVATVTKSSNWTTLDTKATDAQTKANNLVDLTTIKDTRNANNDPQWYFTNYGRKTVKEFKTCTVIGISGEGSFGTLITEVSWNDSSGGYPTQLFYPNNSQNVYRRVGTSTTVWGVWTKVAGTHNAISIINQTAEQIKIQASKISLEGVVTANQYFKILADGSMEATNATITGNIVGGTITGNTTINVGTDLTVGNNIYINKGYSTTKGIYFSDKSCIESHAGDGTRIKSDRIVEMTIVDDILDPRIKVMHTTKGGSFAEMWCGGSGIIVYDDSISLDFLNGHIETGDQGLELYGNTPFIDFHHNNIGDDYTSRLIAYNKGELTCEGHLRSTGAIYNGYFALQNAEWIGFYNGNGIGGWRKGWMGHDGSSNFMIYNEVDGGHVCGLYLEPGDGSYSNGYIYPLGSGTCTLGTMAHRWARYYGVYASNISSDRRLKENFIKFDERYIELFEKLEPTIYNLKQSSNRNKEAGMIAQDVKSAMDKCNITQQEFGVYEIDKDGMYSLIYQDINILTTYYVQTKCKQFDKDISSIKCIQTEHKKEIQELKNENAKLKQELKNTQAKLDAFISGNFEFKTVTREVV